MNRPPAFQCYASDLLASEWFFTLSAEDRGVYFSICLGCWVNDTVPQDTGALAQLIRMDVTTVTSALSRLTESGRVLAFPGKPGRLHVAFLTEQMAKLMEKRAQAVTAGKKGGQTTQSRIVQRHDAAARPGARSTDRLSALSREETNRDEKQRTEVYRDGAHADHTRWVEDYDDQARGGDPLNQSVPKMP
jgi:hypothetical protein